jgi:heme exporter protein B
MSQSGSFSAFFNIIRRDLKLAFRHQSEIVNPVIYFIIIGSLFPLAVSTDKAFLTKIAPGVIWVGALLATLLSMDNLFRSDYEDGTLEQLLLSPHPVAFLVLGKIAAHWLVTGLPLLIVSPLLAYSLHMKQEVYPVLLLTILVGTPILSLLGSIGISLTVGLKRGGLLLAVLVLPLYMPVLILASSILRLAANNEPWLAPFFILTAMLTLSLTLAPFATSAALRISIR